MFQPCRVPPVTLSSGCRCDVDLSWRDPRDDMTDNANGRRRLSLDLGCQPQLILLAGVSSDIPTTPHSGISPSVVTRTTLDSTTLARWAGGYRSPAPTPRHTTLRIVRYPTWIVLLSAALRQTRPPHSAINKRGSWRWVENRPDQVRYLQPCEWVRAESGRSGRLTRPSPSKDPAAR